MIRHAVDEHGRLDAVDWTDADDTADSITIRNTHDADLPQVRERCGNCRQDITDVDDHQCPEKRERSERERREWMHTNDDDLEEQCTW